MDVRISQRLLRNLEWNFLNGRLLSKNLRLLFALAAKVRIPPLFATAIGNSDGRFRP
jgi:hypothetical protein